MRGHLRVVLQLYQPIHRTVKAEAQLVTLIGCHVVEHGVHRVSDQLCDVLAQPFGRQHFGLNWVLAFQPAHTAWR